ncbi:DUF2163 domain-containing protein [Siccirubricoccus deserti]
MSEATRVTQFAAEELDAGGGSVDFTQVAAEELDGGGGSVDFTQVAAEELDGGGGSVNVTQLVLEVLAEDVFPARLTQFRTEALVASSMAGDAAATTCDLWRIRRRDATVLRFAALDRDVVYGGEVYSAAAPFEATASESNRTLAAGQMEVAGILSSPALSAADLLNGLYDDADYTVMLVDWADPGRGVEVKRAGRIGTVKAGETQFSAELFDDARRLDTPVLDVVSPECRVVLGSARCGIVLATWTRTATVTSVDGALHPPARASPKLLDGRPMAGSQ